VQQQPEQRSTGDAGQAAAPVEFLIEFIRQVIRNNPQGDLYKLAMYAANDRVPLTEEQQVAFLRAIYHEQDRSYWPKGFF
jgi:hypothetical protein